MGCRIGAILLHTDIAYEQFHAMTSHVREFPANTSPVSYQPVRRREHAGPIWSYGGLELGRLGFGRAVAGGTSE
jgi:hypothetical protein